jgi:exopolysaccharide biosynthesis polyprenyl glycosylphosphotransferase
MASNPEPLGGIADSPAHRRRAHDLVRARHAGSADAAPPRLMPRSRYRDVRARRPAVLSLLLRWDTARRLARVVSLLALDFVGVAAAIFTALAFKAVIVSRFELTNVVTGTRSLVAFAYLVTALLFARSGMYARRSERPGFPRILASLFQVTVVALLFAVVSGEHYSSYYIFYGSFAFGLLYITSLRYLYERASGALLRAAGYKRRAVIVGSGSHIEAVARILGGGPHPDVGVVGFISLEPLQAEGLVSLGSIDDLDAVITDNRIDEVIVADPAFPQARAVALVDVAHERGVRVRIAPSTMEILVHRAEFVPGQVVPLFELRPPVFQGTDFALKRTFDLVVAALLLIVLSPLLLAIALAVKLTSRGPVFYRAERPGIGGAPFVCLKFRTMYDDAELDQPGLEASNEASGALFKIRNDPRRTPVGRWLRRCSFDELPQLVNVLRGQMSLVGPRPLPMRDYERLEDWHLKRYLVLPGMTGLWQVSGRAELDFDDLVRLDFLYLERWSVFLDLTILVKTIPAVLWGRGAF